MAEISDWDVAAGNNNDAPPNGFPENMIPSALNDGIRENMAVLARYDQTTRGGLITAGAAEAFTLVIPQTISSYFVGLMCAFTANRDNTTATMTLNLNGVAAAPVKTSAGDDPLPGTIRSGGVYSVTFTGTNFVLHSIATNLPPNTLYYPWNFDASDDDQTSVIWTKPAGLKQARFTVTAGGGGAEHGYSNRQSGSGASSGTAVATFNAADLGVTENCLIGRGGHGGLGDTLNFAESGYGSLVGIHVIVPGGGRSGRGVGPFSWEAGIASLPVVSLFAVSSLIYPGSDGSDGVNTPSSFVTTQLGGISIYGGARGATTLPSAGNNNSSGFGSGAPGAVADDTNRQDAANGLLIIDEFF